MLGKSIPLYFFKINSYLGPYEPLALLLLLRLYQIAQQSDPFFLSQKPALLSPVAGSTNSYAQYSHYPVTLQSDFLLIPSESVQLLLLLAKGSLIIRFNCSDDVLHKLTTATYNGWPPSNLEFLGVGLLVTHRSRTQFKIPQSSLPLIISFTKAWSAFTKQLLQLNTENTS